MTQISQELGNAQAQYAADLESKDQALASMAEANAAQLEEVSARHREEVARHLAEHVVSLEEFIRRAPSICSAPSSLVAVI